VPQEEDRTAQANLKHPSDPENQQDSILVTTGVKSVGGGLWRKDGVMFSRGAALQNAEQKLHERGETIYP
jgi:hypothetical protein